ncbi:MAG: response regulator [Bdellovibrionales bacterium]|nr:response regulator [Bdellovibrionales bacterium]
MSYLSEEELDEFIVESEELLDQAEESLLKVDQTGDLTQEYAAIFRVYHSLKGAAGMVGMEHLQKYMHIVESLFEEKKGGQINKSELTFYLKAVDDARAILRGDTSIPLPPEDGVTGDTPAIPTQISNLPEPELITTESAKSNTKPSIAIPTDPSDNSELKDTSLDSTGLLYFVDDEEELLDLYFAMFADSGYSIQTFNDPSLALEAIRKETPDVVISDFKMPNLSGIELLAEIRQFNSELPFVLCSGFLDKEITMKAHQLNLYAAMDKPFEESKLQFVIKNAITHHKTQKLVSKLINFLMRQFNLMEECLKKSGRDDQIQELRQDLKYLLQQKRLLRSHQGKAS